MYSVDKFYETLDSYFAKQQIDQVDPFLVSSLEQAKEEEDYGAYISVCNEMIGESSDKITVLLSPVILLLTASSARTKEWKNSTALRL